MSNLPGAVAVVYSATPRAQPTGMTPVPYRRQKRDKSAVKQSVAPYGRGQVGLMWPASRGPR